MFKFPNGLIKNALVLARDVVADWEQLLARYGVSLSSPPYATGK